ncbi:MAG TPA: response regulator [Candidatus Binataceae bacterium]|nr:response regulator [Candidatus Binataceae bacterium]
MIERIMTSMPTADDGIVGLRILVVEDEALIAESISTGLTRAGCNIVAAVDTGAAAIEAATELRPDLVLMDIHLKGEMDGIEAASVITERLRVPVVYLTAHSDRATLQRATAAQMSSLI